MSSRPTKRQRTESRITRSEICWHSDGSIVLQADTTQFRVHWSVLSLHSSYFREMQGKPQPPDQPSVDGCPIVELQDAAVDVEHLLKAIYDPTFLAQTAVPLSAIAALIRLGRKYDFRNLFDLAVGRLTFENPTTLAEYDGLMPADGKYETTRILHYHGVLYDMVTVARENSILSALPCAYYRALYYHNRSSVTHLLDGISRGDGTSSSLAPIDQRRCLVGCEKLIRAQTQEGYTLGWLRSWDADGCIDPVGCTKWRASMLRKYFDMLTVWAFTPFNRIGSPLCEPCNKHLKASVVGGRKKVWEELPSFFELPSWSELKNSLPP
ncbi:hypothetical protein B0H19DRAFT_1090540 [Mycena capillaripes]|nr:hypothetical protein B0H19DRAFT_1090540 [Mycena capillaripes]